MKQEEIKFKDVLRMCGVHHAYGDTEHVKMFAPAISGIIRYLEEDDNDGIFTFSIGDPWGFRYFVITGTFVDETRFLYLEDINSLPGTYGTYLKQFIQSQESGEFNIPLLSIVVPLLKEVLSDVPFVEELKAEGRVEESLDFVYH